MISLDFNDAPKKRRAERRENDAYMTPPKLADAIVATLASRLSLAVARSPSDYFCPKPSRIIEPSCGEGEFIRPLRAALPTSAIVGIDINGALSSKIEAFGAKFVEHDFLTLPAATLSSADLIITNPPFVRFADFALHALEGMRDGAYLVFLLRMGMLAWTEDMQDYFWQKKDATGLSAYDQLVAVAPICPRPSFTGDGKTDSQEYGIAIWKKGAIEGFADFWPAIRWEKERSPRGRRKKTINGTGDPFGG